MEKAYGDDKYAIVYRRYKERFLSQVSSATVIRVLLSSPTHCPSQQLGYNTRWRGQMNEKVRNAIASAVSRSVGQVCSDIFKHCRSKRDCKLAVLVDCRRSRGHSL